MGLQMTQTAAQGVHLIYPSDKCHCRGRAVTNVERTCGPTPLLYIYMYRKGNKICLTLMSLYIRRREYVIFSKKAVVL